MRTDQNIIDLLKDEQKPDIEEISYAYLGTTVKSKVESSYTIIKNLGKGTFG